MEYLYKTSRKKWWKSKSKYEISRTNSEITSNQWGKVLNIELTTRQILIFASSLKKFTHPTLSNNSWNLFSFWYYCITELLMGWYKKLKTHFITRHSSILCRDQQQITYLLVNPLLSYVVYLIILILEAWVCIKLLLWWCLLWCVYWTLWW